MQRLLISISALIAGVRLLEGNVGAAAGATVGRMSGGRPMKDGGRWEGPANVSLIGALAAHALCQALVRVAPKAQSFNGVPSAKKLGTVPARIK